MSTDRFMCLGCGRFWATGERPVTRCPYCGDVYYTNNIIENIPPNLGNIRIDFECGHCLSTDVALDVTMCCCCGNVNKLYLYGGNRQSLKMWQEKILKTLGI